MLVDNGVTGDSRVQKEARSMASAGFEVHLVGRAPATAPVTWPLGKATVRLVPVAGRQPPHEHRSPRSRNPLAYSTAGQIDAAYRALAARRAELGAARGMATLRPAWQRRVLGRAHNARAGLLRANERWVRFRDAQTEQVQRRRRSMSEPVDRFTTRFWQWILRDRAWRMLDPHLWDLEFAFAPVIDELKPHIIHANDFRTLGVAVRAKYRAAAAGREVRVVWDAHEFLPGIRPWNPHPRWHVAQLAHEREYARHADAVVTVSAELADLLQAEHDLPERPAVVLNCPRLPRRPVELTATIRDSCGLGPGDPLMVYSGGAAPQRGLDLMVDALASIPELACAFVVPDPQAPYLQQLAERAEALGVADRLHLLRYVPYHQVPAYLASADLGVIPLHHYPNHEIALITKFFEYAHARLPIVVSDVRAMAQAVTTHGIGEVFPAQRLDAFVAAVRLVLQDPARYRAGYRDELLAQWSWQSQAKVLAEVYSSPPAPRG